MTFCAKLWQSAFNRSIASTLKDTPLNNLDFVARTRSLLWGLVAACGLLPGLAMALECPSRLRISFFDFEISPLVNGEGISFATPPGIWVEWAQAAVAATGCAPALELTRRPRRRALQEMQYDEIEMMFGTPDDEDRLEQMRYPLRNGLADERLSFYKSDRLLWVRTGNTTIHWKDKQLTGPTNFKVGVPPGTVHELLAKRLGWRTDVGLNGPKTIEQLLLGRFDVAMVAEETVAALPPERRALLRPLRPAVEALNFYSPVSHRFYAEHPEFTRAYWQALCKIAAGDHRIAQSKRPARCPATPKP